MFKAYTKHNQTTQSFSLILLSVHVQIQPHQTIPIILLKKYPPDIHNTQPNHTITQSLISIIIIIFGPAYRATGIELYYSLVVCSKQY